MFKLNFQNIFHGDNIVYWNFVGQNKYDMTLSYHPIPTRGYKTG